MKTCAWLTLSLLLSSAACVNAAFVSAALAEESTVLPGETVGVVVSNRDVNRIYCSEDVQDVVWSKEKPVTVKVSGANVFVKFLVAREGDAEKHVSSSLDLHVVCSAEVYSLILHPREVDSATVRLGSSIKKELAATAKEWGSLPLEDKVKRLTLIAYRHETPAGFSRHPIEASDPRSHIQAYQDLEIAGLADLLAAGTGLRATEYTVHAAKAMTLSERDFLLKDMGHIVGVTVDPLYVAAQGASRVIVITRSTGDGSTAEPSTGVGSSGDEH